MKLVFVLMIAAVMAGCAGQKWDDYADANGCVATEQTMVKQELTQTQGITMTLMHVPMTTYAPPIVRKKKYQLFECKNGPIWAPVSGSEIVANK